MALNFANNNSLSAITSLPASISGGGMTLIQEQTASSSATIDFTSGIDSTYDSYVFKFMSIHAETSNADFTVNFRDGGSNFDATKTTTTFTVSHTETDGGDGLVYRGSKDLAQSTSDQPLAQEVSNDNDASTSGYLHLFNPSSTTFVKHFIGVANSYHIGNQSFAIHYAGYCNTTSAIDGVRFKMSSGNIDSGVIKLYGIS
nr:hypothetical protein [uncultured Mediterranean phage uvMED]